MEFNLGLDCTDSASKGGCTTWTFSKILDKLIQNNPDLIFMDFPKLIRLNPNVPIRTRGNAALSIKFESNMSIDEIANIAIPIVDNDAKIYLDEDKKPGLLIIEGKITNQEFYEKTLQNHISVQNLPKIKNSAYFWPKKNQSHIGAMAAITSNLVRDLTFEIIAYRTESKFGKARSIDRDNLIKLIHLYPSTFSSYDYYGKRELISPAGPDPIFCGIRGESPLDLINFFDKLNLEEDISSWTLFKTNQATNSHVLRPQSTLIPFSVISSIATVVASPFEYQGGHIKLKLSMNSKTIECMVFEPTKHLRDTARKLIIGDKLYIHANVRKNDYGIHIALEHFYIIHLEKKIYFAPPICQCGKRMTKAGTLKGYKCRNCGNKTLIPEKKPGQRNIFVGQKAFAALSAQRHLTRPSKRMHRRNRLPVTEARFSDFRRILN